MKKCGYAVMAKDGYILFHTIRTTVNASKLAYELYHKKNWSLAAAQKYEVIKINIGYNNGPLVPAVNCE